jgi:uncharacterized protein YndB with AHSA1/START domain
MSIQKEIVIKSDLDSVWKSWTDSDRVAQWFAPAAEVESKIGGKYEVYFNPADKDTMSTKGCKVLKIVKSKLLAFDWKGPDQFAEIMNNPNELTVVEVSFTEQGENLLVLLKHSGWKDSDGWSAAKQWHVHAWDDVFSSLKSKIESENKI